VIFIADFLLVAPRICNPVRDRAVRAPVPRLQQNGPLAARKNHGEAPVPARRRVHDCT
jgi:hypothetical protein